jgi:hypothetical protein
MWPRLAPHELVHDLFGARPLLAASAQGILNEAEQAMLIRARSSSLDDVPWTSADAALIDEAREVLGPWRPRPARSRTDQRANTDRPADVGFWPAGLDPSPEPANIVPVVLDEVRSFGHIVVDEAQDLSPMQLRMLARRSLSGSMTVVGDIAQATGPWTPKRWDEVVAHLSPKHPPNLVELTVSYRTPAEVVAVAARALRAAVPELAPPIPVRRSGHEPLIEQVSRGALSSRVAEVAADQIVAVAPGRVAVLAPDILLPELQRALVEQGLNPVDPRDPGGLGLGAPLVLLSANEAHGLEFDAVVVVEPAGMAEDAVSGAERPKPGDSRGLRTLYVALTRPTQLLAVLHALPLPVNLAAD